ncbi:MAG: hypothetical protein JXR77_04735 [Lentisphaeria bacterium]|nr:hypothetical protein [Lentisphaeria bacterium]
MNTPCAAVVTTCIAWTCLHGLPVPAGDIHCQEGVLRRRDSGAEVACFGVNYYAPFALDYQGLARAGASYDEEIRRDLTHLQRLGLDALRLHCWDREISAADGTLLDNEHLRLLDRLVAEAGARGFVVVLTPIAWWGTPTPGTPGFSNRFTMQQLTTDPEARSCQRRYLAGFVAHRNRYSGRTYMEDPAVAAFELINEPIYPSGTTDDQVIEYIDALAAAVRAAGCRKPIFYNCWGGREAAASRARLDGVTFGWYPTGLVAGHALTHNALPSVDRHHSAHTPCLDAMAKIVYEFDAADVDGSYIYPAMAREFRAAGIQIATQFQYDAVALAAGNENWQTHFLNLLYTPGKAISFAVAARAFRQLPRHTAAGSYPDNTRFANARVSYEQDLSEWVTQTEFLHSNSTRTQPPDPARLEHVWGVGTSPVATYGGTGAYFLDRAAPGLWHLQVYPDAVTVADPYTGGTAEKVRLLHARQPLGLRLPDLGEAFLVSTYAEPARATPARAGAITVQPGYYLLRRDADVPSRPPDPLPFWIPEPTPRADVACRFEPPRLWREGDDLPIQTTVAAAGDTVATLLLRTGTAPESLRLPMASPAPYRFAAILPGHLLRPGNAALSVEIANAGAVRRFPGNRLPDGPPPPPPFPCLTLSAVQAPPEIQGSGILRGEPRAAIVAGRTPNEAALRLEAGGFGPPPSCIGIRLPATGPANRTDAYDTLVVSLRAAPQTPFLEVSLVEEDGTAFGTDVAAGPEWQSVHIPLGSLRPMWGTGGQRPNPARLAQVALVTGAWVLPATREADHWVEVASVALAAGSPDATVAVIPRQGPVPLILPGSLPRAPKTHGHPAGVAVRPGNQPGEGILRIAVGGFGPEPDATGFRLGVPPERARWAAELEGNPVLQVQARGLDPRTNGIEIALVERDGTPWGAVLPLTERWEVRTVPLADLRFFGHWQVPPGRGQAGDRIRVADISHVNLCFGAWLYGGERDLPHTIEIGTVGIAPSP